MTTQFKDQTGRVASAQNRVIETHEILKDIRDGFLNTAERFVADSLSGAATPNLRLAVEFHRHAHRVAAIDTKLIESQLGILYPDTAEINTAFRLSVAKGGLSKFVEDLDKSGMDHYSASIHAWRQTTKDREITAGKALTSLSKRIKTEVLPTLPPYT